MQTCFFTERDSNVFEHILHMATLGIAPGQPQTRSKWYQCDIPSFSKMSWFPKKKEWRFPKKGAPPGDNANGAARNEQALALSRSASHGSQIHHKIAWDII